LNTTRDTPTAAGAVSAWAGAVVDLAARRPVLFVLAVVAVLYLPWLEAAPISGSIEGHRLVAAREMLRSGDWVVPRLNGEVYLAKPPFQYWLIALLSLPLGDTSLWTSRFVSALSVVTMCALVAFWARCELSPRAGIRAGLMIALSGVLLEKGVLAELEAVLAVTTTAALSLLWFSVWSETRRRLLVVGACITDRAVARRILRHLGLPDEPPVSTPARAPPVLDFGTRAKCGQRSRSARRGASERRRSAPRDGWQRWRVTGTFEPGQ